MVAKNDLKKAITAAESAKKAYARVAQSTEDQNEKQLFHSMNQDIDQHISRLLCNLNGIQYVPGSRVCNNGADLLCEESGGWKPVGRC